MIPPIKPLERSGNFLVDNYDDELEEESRREDEIDEAEYKIRDMTPELPSDFDYSRTDLEGVLQMIETGHMSVACASHYIKNIFEIIDAIKARTKSPNAD